MEHKILWGRRLRCEYFNVFTFLSDKGVFGYETDEDDYFKLYYVSSLSGKFFTLDEIKSIYENYSREDI